MQIAPGFFVVRRACSAAGGCESRPNLMEVKGSEAHGRRREAGSEGSASKDTGSTGDGRISSRRKFCGASDMRRTDSPDAAVGECKAGALGREPVLRSVADRRDLE